VTFTERAATRLFIIDDHELVRTGLRRVLECEADFEVVGEAGTADEGFQAVRELRPDVVLLDIRLPDRSGIEVCRQIRDACPETRVVMLTSVGMANAVEQTILAGASSFLLKENSNADLIKAIRAVSEGRAILDPHITHQVLARIRALATRPHTPAYDALTAQELRVLAILAEGKTNKEIARDLSVSEKTVRNHVYNLFQKLGVTSRSQATARYLRTFPS
jgi:two-component system, NarL family, response regulator DevR